MMPARIGNAGRLVNRECDGEGVDRLPSFRHCARTAFADDAPHVRIGNLPPADGPLHVEQTAFGLPAGEIYRDAAKPVIGHVFGHGDRGADRTFRFVQIRYTAAAHAARARETAAKGAQRAIRVGAADEACDLGAANIQNAERTRTQIARARRRIGRHGGRKG